MKTQLTALIALLTFLPCAFAGDDHIFAKDSEWEILSEGHQFAEGMAWDSEGHFYFTDVPRSQLFKIDKSTGKKSLVVADTGKANGIAFGPDGRLYGCSSEADGITAWNVATWKKEVYGLGAKSNDLAIFDDGSIYFTDPTTNSIWRIDGESRQRTLAIQLDFRPNGIALSPDKRSLFVASFLADTIYAWSIDESGQLKSDASIGYVLDVPSDGKGKLDGMQVLPGGRLVAGTALGIQIAVPFDHEKKSRPIIHHPHPENGPRCNYVRISPDGEWLYACFVNDVRRRLISAELNQEAVPQGELKAEAKVAPEIHTILKNHCYDCHDGDTQEGDVNLYEFSELARDARLELLNRMEEQVYLSQMPPEEMQQPTAAERKQLLAWVSRSFDSLGAKSEFREKLHEPEYGNYVDHEKLFSGKIKEKPYSPSRRWLISPYIFESKVLAILGGKPKDVEIMNPMHLPDVSGVRDYDNKLAGGAHFITMLANAKAMADHQLGIISPEKFKAAAETRARILANIADYEKRNPTHRRLNQFRNSLAKLDAEVEKAKNGVRIDDPFRTITSKSTPPGDWKMKVAINHQYALVYARKPNPTEMAGCLDLMKASIAKVGNTEGLKRMLMAVLLQPDFLYRSELGEGPEDEHGRRRLSSREASYAIAYALTERGPDRELKLAGQEGQLETKEQYKKHLERLLASQRGYTRIDGRIATNRTGGYATLQPAKLRFFREFFGYSKAYQIFKDNKRFEGATNKRNEHDYAIRLMINEADLMVDRILAKDQNVFRELLTSDRFYLYHNGDNVKAQRFLADRKRLLKQMSDDYKKMTPQEFWETYDVDLDVHFGLDSRKKLNRKVAVEIDRLMKSIEWDRDPIIYPRAYNRKSLKPVRDGMMAKNRTNMFNIDHNTWSYVAEQPFKIPNRKGILTHPAWLTAHSLNTSTDPVKRGKWVREKLLAGFIPDVPITVDAAIPEDHNKTLRQRLHDKTKHESCWKCHESMNPLGYAFEIYDDFGRFRLKEELEYPEHLIKKTPDEGPYTRNTYKTMPLDTTGYLSGTGNSALDGEVKDALDLIDRLAKSDRVRQSIIRHAFRFFMGRNEMLSDSQTLIDADNAYLASNGSFNAVVVALLTSDSFMYRK